MRKIDGRKLAKILPFLILIILLSNLTAGCTRGEAAGTGEQDMPMAPLSDMPQEVQDAPVTVQQSYQFAAANPDVLEQIPCYCGCGAMGHTSNYACYVSGKDERGEITFDQHALGCSICVDITLDTMRMLKEGKAVPEIRSVIDETYSRYGPSNIP
jgi:hypothetical protein